MDMPLEMQINQLKATARLNIRIQRHAILFISPKELGLDPSKTLHLTRSQLSVYDGDDETNK